MLAKGEAMAGLAGQRGALFERTVMVDHEVLAGRHRSVRSYLDGRHDGRTGDHAGLRRLQHPDLGPAAGHNDPGLHHRRYRRERHQRPRHQPGRAQHRVADDCFAHFHASQGDHGALRQRARDESRGRRRHRCGAGAQRHSHRSDVRAPIPGLPDAD
jgi:hypothetical protein